jgi:hypothetical protein
MTDPYALALALAERAAEMAANMDRDLAARGLTPVTRAILLEAVAHKLLLRVAELEGRP